MTDPATEGTDAATALEPVIPAAATTIGRASAILASGTIVSRVLGFISAAALASAIGLQNPASDAFSLANQLPNNVYALIAGGLLSAVIVPQIVRAGIHDDGGQRFMSRLLTLGFVLFAAVTIVVVLCTPLLVRLYAGTEVSDAQLQLAIGFAYWCMPQVFFYALYSLIGETLNARGVFGPVTWTPVLNNVVAIAGVLTFIALFGPFPSRLALDSWGPAEIGVLAGSATLGIAVQAAGLLFFWRRTGLHYRPDFHWRGVGLGSAGRSAAWVFGMFLVTQVSGVVESQVALSASGRGASVTVIKYAWLMFILPHSIATVSIVTAYFTRMSGHARDGLFSLVRGDLGSSLRTVLLIMVFATVGLGVLAYPFSAVFGQTYAEVQSLAAVYLAFLTGLIPFTVFFVLLRVYYAVDDTRTPFIIQVVQTSTYIVGALLVGHFVADEWIAVGLGLVLSAALLLQAVLSAIFLRRRLGGLETWAVTRQALWYLAATIPAAAAGVGVLLALGGFSAGAFPVEGRFSGILAMIVAGTAMAVVYFGVLWVTRNPELRSFAEPVLARIRPRSRPGSAE